MNCNYVPLALAYVLLLCLEAVLTRTTYNNPYDDEYPEVYQYEQLSLPAEYVEELPVSRNNLLDIFKSTRKRSRQVAKRCYSSRNCCKTTADCCPGYTCGVNIWNWSCYECIKKTWGR
ncbi:uncharacterized protein LOC135483929 [Lineus longissimus]|uniref:uncharacterized protein LOC135483929 n=1 Tax=Lineus longissimus TaxID=88925 RepID=UPI002B4CF91D